MEIGTETEQTAIAEHLKVKLGGGWIGLNNKNDARDFVWDKSKIKADGQFTNWEQNEVEVDKRCVRFLGNNRDYHGKWRKLDCTHTNPYSMCEKDITGGATGDSKNDKWAKVFQHFTSSGLFSSAEDAMLKNPDSPDSDLFSKLEELGGLRWDDGTFHLKLCYPGLTGTGNAGGSGGGSGYPCNEWTQTSNPFTTQTIYGFRPVNLAFPEEFKGLAPSSSNERLIDGGQEGFAVGASTYLNEEEKTIPGPFFDGLYQEVDKVVLFAGSQIHLFNSSLPFPRTCWMSETIN